jgi:phosphoribosylglycinamide formyltransferase-1
MNVEARVRLCIAVSGSGTILEAILASGIPVAMVVADRPCRALEVAKEAAARQEAAKQEAATQAARAPQSSGAAGSMLVSLVQRESFGPDFNRDAYTERLVSHLERAHIDLVAMAGFGTVLGKAVHLAYPGRILNTHPSVLPAFKGWHAVRDALVAGVSETGCTVHLAQVEVDEGPILAQARVPVRPGDDEASLHARIKERERVIYPEVIAKVMAHMERGGEPVDLAIGQTEGLR